MTKRQFPGIFPLPFTKITSNNQGYGVGATTIEGQNAFCSSAVLCVSFTRQMVKDASDQSAFCTFYTFLGKSKRMLATYMRRMRNCNLEIRIAGSSCRPQLTIISRVRVGYEMVKSQQGALAIIISYPTSASEIIIH